MKTCTAHKICLEIESKEKNGKMHLLQFPWPVFNFELFQNLTTLVDSDFFLSKNYNKKCRQTVF